MSVKTEAGLKKQKRNRTRVHAMRTTEFRPDVRLVMREKVFAEVYAVLDNSNELPPMYLGFITDVSSRGFGLIVEVPRGQTFCSETTKFQLRIFGRTFEGVIDAKLAWSAPLPTLGGIIRLRFNEDGEEDIVYPMRCGFYVETLDSPGTADFMMKLMALANR